MGMPNETLEAKKAKTSSRMLKKFILLIEITAIFFCLLVFNQSRALSEEFYQFVRMWPTLLQPWYFKGPEDIAVDDNGNVYVVDTANHRIQKFTADGQFITRWGRVGSNKGEFNHPVAAATDSIGNVYVLEKGNHRVQQFSSNGEFITEWGSEGSNNGQFQDPQGIAIDSSGNVFIADTENDRIQKFTSLGQFITKWGSYGVGEEEFRSPTGIAVDINGNVYVADFWNFSIKKFNSNGQLLTTLHQSYKPYDVTVDSSGNIYAAENDPNFEYYNGYIWKYSSEGQYLTSWNSYSPYGIEIDKNENLYVAENRDDLIRKFTANGQLIVKWGSMGRGNGEFDEPFGIAVDTSGNIYVTDSENSRIQKFTADGRFITQWGSWGSGDDQFHAPMGIAVDISGNVYVAEYFNPKNWSTNYASFSLIKKFSPTAQFITKWGGFNRPRGIAVDNVGSIYVTDKGDLAFIDSCVKKFTSYGVFIELLGDYGYNAGEFRGAVDVFVHTDGSIYTVEGERWANHRVQKFRSDGQFIDMWGDEGSGIGEFQSPGAIAVGNDGIVYVADSGNHRIQTFTADGNFITAWGEQGSDFGKFNNPGGIVVGTNGLVYVSDTKNNRIQVFKKVTLDAKRKAVIVAGGGPYHGNNLWNATQLCANFAYRTLTYQGYTKESIYYLTSDTDLDLDSNGEYDDVDANATNNDLQYAITTWATDATNLVLYLVDHGGNSTFRMSSNQTLSASDLDIWLDQLQQIISGKVTVIYDACESGSFLASLTPPTGKERIVITSTSPEESAYFVTQGSISFSNYFWTHIFNGINIKNAYGLSQEAIGYATDYQNPLLDANGNGVANEAEDFVLLQDIYIGNGTQIHGDAPVIGDISPDKIISGKNFASLFANDVVDSEGIARVWAVIRPPDYHQGSADNPVQELPSIDLMPVGGNRYEATYGEFSFTGTYQIAIYARDRIGNTAIPKLTTVSVENPLRRRAILVVGAAQADAIWPATEQNIKLGHKALSFQGYTDEDIYLLSPTSIPGVTKFPVLATLSNLAYALNTWALSNTQDVVLYLIGNGNSGSFKVNATEELTAPVLDGWLDNLQSSIPGKVTVIYDACQSGSFLSFLKPPVDKERIVLASAGGNQPACFLLDGAISFSKYFWSQVANGANVRDAFLHAKQAVEFTTARMQGGAVVARLDDNGNGLGNEKSDGQIARNYTIGVGIMLAGDNPLIGSISPEQTIPAGASATIWADDVTTTGSIARVWAVITPPGFTTGSASDPVVDIPTVELTAAGGNRYGGSFNEFSSFGTYRVTVYAMDTEGAISLPKETTFCYVTCSDDYEEDDAYAQATVIVINDESSQAHNFHDAGDQDWVKFYGLSGQTYTIAVENAGSSCDAVIEVYDIDGATKLADRDDTSAGEDEELAWSCPRDGIHFVKVKQFNPTVFGEDTEYELKVYNPIGPLVGFVTGVISDAMSSQVIGDVQIKTNSNHTALSLPTGDYLLVHPPGTYLVTAEKAGYSVKEIAGIEISEGGSTPLSISLELIDTDNDGISDAVENAVACLDANDADRDDDGILDGNEDANHDGVVDVGETDPCEEDTDNDGLLDGTEIGLTAPQGSGTDLGVFIADADPTIPTMTAGWMAKKI